MKKILLGLMVAVCVLPAFAAEGDGENFCDLAGDHSTVTIVPGQPPQDASPQNGAPAESPVRGGWGLSGWYQWLKGSQEVIAEEATSGAILENGLVPETTQQNSSLLDSLQDIIDDPSLSKGAHLLGLSSWVESPPQKRELTLEEIPEDGPVAGKVYLKKKEDNNQLKLNCTALIRFEEDGVPKTLPISLDIDLSIDPSLDPELLQSIGDDILQTFEQKWEEARIFGKLGEHIYLKETEPTQSIWKKLEEGKKPKGHPYPNPNTIEAGENVREASQGHSSSTLKPKEFITNASSDDPLEGASPALPEQGKLERVVGITQSFLGGYLGGYLGLSQGEQQEEELTELGDLHQKEEEKRKNGYYFHSMKDLPMSGVAPQNTIYIGKKFDKVEFSVTINSGEPNPNLPISGPLGRLQTNNPSIYMLNSINTPHGKKFYGLLNIKIEKEELTLDDLKSIGSNILEILKEEEIIPPNQEEAYHSYSDAPLDQAKETPTDKPQQQTAPNAGEENQPNSSLLASLQSLVPASPLSRLPPLMGIAQNFLGNTRPSPESETQEVEAKVESEDELIYSEEEEEKQKEQEKADHLFYLEGYYFHLTKDLHRHTVNEQNRIYIGKKTNKVEVIFSTHLKENPAINGQWQKWKKKDSRIEYLRFLDTCSSRKFWGILNINITGQELMPDDLKVIAPQVLGILKKERIIGEDEVTQLVSALGRLKQGQYR